MSDDRTRNRGLIFEPRRFNVATTRSKELLVIIGNAQILYADPYWRYLIRFAVRRGAYNGPDLQELGIDDGAAVETSKLEENFVGRHMHMSDVGIVAGSVARLALTGE